MQEEDELSRLLDKIPYKITREDLAPYLETSSKLTYSEINGYIILGVKSINKHFTKTHYALCLGCLEKYKNLDRVFYSGQKNQFKNKQPCGCSGSDGSFRKNLKSKVDSWLAPHPHLHYVTHNQKSVELLCDNHGCFSMKVSSFSGNSEKKFYCKNCYNAHLSVQGKEAAKKRSNKHFSYPYPKKGVEYTLGNTFKAKKGNLYTVVKVHGKSYINISCDTCGDTCKVYTSNLKVGQTPCSCSGKSEPKRVGDVVETMHGNFLTVAEEDTKYLYVECNICHQDSELWDKPIRVLRATINKGSSPCACGKSCLYTNSQYKTKVSRKLSNIPCSTKVAFPSERLTSKSYIDVRCNIHKEYYKYNLQSFLLEDVKCTLCHPSMTGFDVNKNGVLYIMVFESVNDENHVFKIGITNGTPWKRFKSIMSKTKGYTGYIYSAFEFTSGQTCLDIEKEFKGLYTKKKGSALKVRFRDGFTETFPWSLDTLYDLQSDIVFTLGVCFTSRDYDFQDVPNHEGAVRLLRHSEYGGGNGI